MIFTISLVHITGSILCQTFKSAVMEKQIPVACMSVRWSVTFIHNLYVNIKITCLVFPSRFFPLHWKAATALNRYLIIFYRTVEERSPFSEIFLGIFGHLLGTLKVRKLSDPANKHGHVGNGKDTRIWKYLFCTYIQEHPTKKFTLRQNNAKKGNIFSKSRKFEVIRHVTLDYEPNSEQISYWNNPLGAPDNMHINR